MGGGVIPAILGYWGGGGGKAKYKNTYEGRLKYPYEEPIGKRITLCESNMPCSKEGSPKEGLVGGVVLGQ